MAVNVVLEGVVSSTSFFIPSHKSMVPVVAHEWLAIRFADQIFSKLSDNLQSGVPQTYNLSANAQTERNEFHKILEKLV